MLFSYLESVVTQVMILCANRERFMVESMMCCGKQCVLSGGRSGLSILDWWMEDKQQGQGSVCDMSEVFCRWSFRSANRRQTASKWRSMWRSCSAAPAAAARASWPPWKRTMASLRMTSTTRSSSSISGQDCVTAPSAVIITLCCGILLQL